MENENRRKTPFTLWENLLQLKRTENIPQNLGYIRHEGMWTEKNGKIYGNAGILWIFFITFSVKREIFPIFCIPIFHKYHRVWGVLNRFDLENIFQMPDSQPGKMIFSNSQFFLLKRFSISQIFVCRFLIRSVESSLVENFQFLKNQMKILRHSDGWITRGSLYWNLRPVVALLNALNRPHFDYSSTPCATKRI